MPTIKVDTTIQKAGELLLTNLPIQANQRVEVIVIVPEDPPSTQPPHFLTGEEEEWQKLVASIRQEEPYFSSLDEAMNASRKRT